MKLKDCPFCRCDAMLRVLGNGIDPNEFYVCCPKCPAKTFKFETEQEAIEAWNTRASPWIPVSERLPEKEDLYFTKGIDGDFDTDWFDPKDKAAVKYWETSRSKWMGIPE